MVKILIALALVLGSSGFATSIAQTLKAGGWEVTMTGTKMAGDPSQKQAEDALAGINELLKKSGSKVVEAPKQSQATPFKVVSLECVTKDTPSLSSFKLNMSPSCTTSTKSANGNTVLSYQCTDVPRKGTIEIGAVSNTTVKGTFVESSPNSKIVFNKGDLEGKWISDKCTK